MATPLPPNRAAFRVDEISFVVRGQCFEVDPKRLVSGVTTDSRAVRSGELFVAISGESFDGHRFVDAARAGGASVALVRRDSGVTGPRIEVDDPLVAFGELARAHAARVRAESEAPCIAVGGAVGKTTTKTLLAAGVRAAFGETLATIGNLNNRIGVPAMLLTARADQRALVVECGTSEQGEIAVLGALVEPDVALVLNVDVEHTEGLGTLADVADEEAALFRFARSRSVTNVDDALLVARLPKGREAITFGRGEDADVRLVERRWAGDRQHVALAIRGLPEARIEANMRLLGEAAALNFTAAIAAILALDPAGVHAWRGEGIAKAAAAMGEVEAVEGRFRPRSYGKKGLVFDDTYNANPKSVLAAIAATEEASRILDRPHVLMLGEMRELGAFAPQSHDEVLAAALASHPKLLVLVGAEFKAALARSSAKNVPWFATSAEATTIVKQIDESDLVLVKGSRGVRMEVVVERLLGV